MLKSFKNNEFLMRNLPAEASNGLADKANHAADGSSKLAVAIFEQLDWPNGLADASNATADRPKTPED